MILIARFFMLGCSPLLLGMSNPTDAKPRPPYPEMAPLQHYLVASPAEEIALAREAAPASISDRAEILIFDRGGYRTAVNGTNGFTCLVQRSWTDDFANAEFWNPRIRVPICLNPPAVRSVLPAYLDRTRWVLEGASLVEIKRLATDRPPADPEPGSMAYMMSRNGYLADGIGAAGPHLMFYFHDTPTSIWGADLPNSPVSSTRGDKPSITVFYLSTRKWSDGTLPGS